MQTSNSSTPVLSTSTFTSHPLFRSGHAQTIAAHLFSGEALIKNSKNEVVETKDKDKILCRVSLPDPTIHGEPNRAVFLFHGLGGSSEAVYMTHAARRFNQEGWPVVRVNLRAAGASAPLSQKIYHSGRTQDFEDVFVFFKNKYPQWLHCLFIGYSLSGNIALNYASNPAFAQPQALISVSAPLKLKDVSIHLNSGFNKVYQYKILSDLLKVVEAKKGVGYVQAANLNNFSTLYEFDRAFIFKEAGAATLDEYYRKYSSFESLHKILIPHHLIIAQDDPIVSALPYMQIKLNSQGRLYRFAEGGHLGFMAQGKNFLPERRLEDYLVQIAEKSYREALKI